MFPSLYAYSDLGLLALRIAIGLLFLAHGLPKLSGKMGGFMTLVGVVETVGALGVIVGFYTQIAALGLAVVMLGAIYRKIFDWHVPFSATDKMGWEVDLTLLAASILLMTNGPGAYSAEKMWM
jgi:putative oxidoreductase